MILLIKLFSQLSISNAAMIFSASHADVYIDKNCNIINFSNIKVISSECSPGKKRIEGAELIKILALTSREQESELIKVDRSRHANSEKRTP